jgi:DNA-binding NtrC family response regulator
LKILLIEDDKIFADAFRMVFRPHELDVTWAPTGAKGISEFTANPNGFAVVVIDYELPDLKGSEVCQHLRRINPDQEFLFSTGHQRLDYFTDILETGTDGFFAKGDAIELMCERVLARASKYQTRNRLIGGDNYAMSQAEVELSLAGFTARSRQMFEVLKQIERYSGSPYPTLIVGETGVGKELVAKALTPKGKKLIAVNCPAYLDKENLLESELFGYVKGAFTGADQETVGLVMQAHNNVLFLDELHQLSLSAQAKLLRFLQEMKFRKVGDGSGKELSVNFKLVAAVQSDIKDRVNDGRFLQDLIGRVGVLVIQVPPLRERPEDIEPLVRKFQDEFNHGKDINQKKQFRLSTVEAMTKLPWERNVRTLGAAVKQLLTDCPANIVEPIDLKNYMNSHFLGNQANTNETASHVEEKQKFEFRLFAKALSLSRTRSEAAKRLNLALSTFTRRLKNLGIEPALYLNSSSKSEEASNV